MGYLTMDPERLLRTGFAAPEVAEGAWCTRWDGVTDAAGLCANLLPPVIDFHTSGSTGPARCWRRLQENVWREAGMLADLIAPGRPEAIVSFVPSLHLYGALTSVLMPAWLGLPVWFRPAFVGAMPDVPVRRIAVVATPWIFKLLLEHIGWVRRFEHVTVLYGGAMLPASAGLLLREAERAEIVEVLGSTEAGGVASRRWSEGEPPEWTLFPDVSFAGTTAPGKEVPLSVRGPRLAFRPGERPPDRWTADDIVIPLDDRTFRLVGRTGRLVKVNGRRINLDDAEHALRPVLDCDDLALVPISDELTGEHVELHVVLHPGTQLSDLDLATAIRRLGVRPKCVRAVPRIERSALGKAVTTTKKAEVATP
ncbi:class I adenylate-forming enzyme family protein [Actinocrispum sp. NPDC049592]|uniref:class I adenylate-forming enzyme family protein n=1 Tax=Actinocrispum sp. NPDC049592 TaxID=3154835 RepID=UPI0034366870